MTKFFRNDIKQYPEENYLYNIFLFIAVVRHDAFY